MSYVARIYIADKKIGDQHLTKINDVIVRTRSPNYALHINDKNTGLVVSSIMAVITNIFPNVFANSNMKRNKK